MEKRTFAKLKEIDECVAKLYAKDETLRNAKFGYWYNKFYKKNIAPIVTEIEEKLADCRLENALVDEKTKEILYNGNAFKYNKEDMQNLVNFNRKIIKEYDEKEFDVIPCISSELPEGLEEEEKDLLKGLLI